MTRFNNFLSKNFKNKYFYLIFLNIFFLPTYGSEVNLKLNCNLIREVLSERIINQPLEKESSIIEIDISNKKLVYEFSRGNPNLVSLIDFDVVSFSENSVIANLANQWITITNLMDAKNSIRVTLSNYGKNTKYRTIIHGYCNRNI